MVPTAGKHTNQRKNLEDSFKVFFSWMDLRSARCGVLEELPNHEPALDVRSVNDGNFSDTFKRSCGAGSSQIAVRQSVRRENCEKKLEENVCSGPQLDIQKCHQTIS